MNRRLLLALALLFTAALPAFAVEPFAIQDNSFLIEEAYNQESRVVQHIFNFTRAREGSWVSTFTQEWPVRSQAHQLSFTMPMQRGDSLINYRYQLAGDGSARLAFSPRVSLMISGDRRRFGADVNLPLSFAVSDRLVTHWNAGVTRSPLSSEPLLWSAGGSVIAAPREKFHLMLETRWSGDRDASLLIVSPGIRWAHDVGKLQIVPGIAAPMGSDGSRAIFVYLSLEHPF